MTPIVKRYPKYQLTMIWAGWMMSIAGLLAGSFVTTLPGLIMTQGVLYGGMYLLGSLHTNILCLELLT